MAGHSEIELCDLKADGQGPHLKGVVRPFHRLRGTDDGSYGPRIPGSRRTGDGGAGHDVRRGLRTSDDGPSVQFQGTLSLGVVRDPLAARFPDSAATRALHVLPHRDGLPSEHAFAAHVLAVVDFHGRPPASRLYSLAAVMDPEIPGPRGVA